YETRHYPSLFKTTGRRSSASARRLEGVSISTDGSGEENYGMTEKTAENTATKSQPHRVRLPGLIADDTIGLGGVIKDATYTLGIKRCGGCEGRAAALNRRVVFTRRSK